MDNDENKIEELNEEDVTEQAVEETETQETEESEEAEENEDAEESEEGEEAESENKNKKTSYIKGNQASLFTSETVTAFSAVANSEEMEHKHRSDVAMKTALVMGILTVIAAALRFAAFNVPYLPSFLNYDFSAFPEVIASIAYGPIFGVIIVIIKNFIYVVVKIKTLSIPAIITNVVLNSIFVYITGFYYQRRMFPVNPEYIPKKDKRRAFILSGGTIASGVAAVASFFLAKYVTYPITFKYFSAYTQEHIVYLYQEALNNINGILPNKLNGMITEIGSLTKGIALFNVPHTFFKYFVITLLAMLIYNFISPVLHFRNVKRDKEEE